MRFPFLLLLLLALTTTACNSQSKQTKVSTNEDNMTTVEQGPTYKYVPPAKEGEVVVIEESEDYWREQLTEEEFYILREEGTERSFTSPLLNEKRQGVFTCAACGLPLFASDTKFKSGTGWPSFFKPINDAYIRQDVDNRYGMRRVEVSCARCNGHQGHVFPDGPEPTGLRYCINGLALNFVPIKDFPQAGGK